MFQQVFQKGEESKTNYIKTFQNAKALEISVGNSYTEDQLMNTFLDSLQKGRNYSDQIEIHQAELRREEKFIDKNNYLYLTYKLII